MAVLDLNGIKEQLQTIFEAANTTTATRDLSSGLETRVQKILKVHPGRIPIQANWYPFVTIYIEAKDVAEKSICKGQANSKRRADVDIKIAGCVWNSTVANDDGDDASDDAESLMENIEQILRSYTDINSTVSWSFPVRITYHNYAFEEDASLRAGVMTYRAIAYY